MKKDITLYALSGCPHCARTREFLESRLGPGGFKLLYVDRMSGDERNDSMRELRRVNPAVSFPTTVVDGQVVVGDKQDRLAELLG